MYLTLRLKGFLLELGIGVRGQKLELETKSIARKAMQYRQHLKQTSVQRH